MFLQKLMPILGVTLFGALSPLCAQLAITQTNFTRTYVFPPVGLGISETASVTVVNTAISPVTTGIVSTPSSSCTGTVSFANATGKIGTPASFTVGSGAFDTIMLLFANAGLTGNRGEIQASVALNVGSSASGACSLSFSLETWDSTTFATHVLLSGSMANPGFPIAVPFAR